VGAEVLKVILAIRRVLAVGLVVAGLGLAVPGAGLAAAQEIVPEPPAAEVAVAPPPEEVVPAPAPEPAPAEPAPAPAPAEPAPPAAAPAPAPAAAPVPTPPTAPLPSGRPREGRSRPTPRPRVRRERRAGVRRATGCALKSPSSSSSSGSTSARDCPEAKARRKARAPRVRPRPRRRAASAVPSAAFALPAAGPIGVPNFFIERFRIPPFLLPIYQAAGMEYGVRWEILAAINEIETDYGRNLRVSSAGALGWMQFMPATWKAYGVDANRDGLEDPYNPVDAIFAAARYLRAAGADRDLRGAIFAYNHADWYVNLVLTRARVIGGLPTDLVGSLTGLTQGRFPVAARARYAGQLSGRARTRRTGRGGNAAFLVEAARGRRGIHVFARRGSRVVAVNDGRITRIGRSTRLGRFVQLRDAHGNTYTYGHLGSVARTYLAPKPRRVGARQVARELRLPARGSRPKRAASATTRAGASSKRRTAAPRKRRAAAHSSHSASTHARGSAPARRAASTPRHAPSVQRAASSARSAAPAKRRLFAHPARPAARSAGGEEQLARAEYDPRAALRLGLDPKDHEARRLRKGARVVAGTVLGRVGKVTASGASHLRFEIRPAGRGAPRIDPKPILDGWKLLETTALYRAAGRKPFLGQDAEAPSIGQILLMSKAALQRQVLANPHIEIYECGRRDIRTGQVDRRVLASLEYLAASGLKPTVSSLRCGHGYYTKSGNVSHHSGGSAVDIAAINGISILGNQGKGSVTDLAIQRLLTLQGALQPDQIISLMTFQGAESTIAMSDHHDHIHIGWRPDESSREAHTQHADSVLKPKQWIKLIDRLGEIDNPSVRLQPSRYAVKTLKRGSRSHAGD